MLRVVRAEGLGFRVYGLVYNIRLRGFRVIKPGKICDEDALSSTCPLEAGSCGLGSFSPESPIPLN